MIEFSANIRPFSVKNECGDFYEFLELENYHLLVVADIGGHGSTNVYKIACDMKYFIQQNKSETPANIIKLLHKNEKLKQNGMTIFVAHIYKKQPIVSYSAVGNIKAVIYRDNNILDLNMQEGIVGYDIPRVIKTNILKVMKNDVLLSVTDGVSFHHSSIIQELKNSKDLNQIVKDFTSQFHNDDDSLCIALKFDISNSNNFSLKHDDKLVDNKINTSKHHQTNIKSNTNKTKILKTISTLDKNALLIKHLKKEFVSLSIEKLKSLLSIPSYDYIKIKTFLLEIVKFSQVDIYLQNNIVQIYIYNITSVQDSLEFLFENYYVSGDNSCVINIVIKNNIRLDKDEFSELKQMLELGLDDEGYKQYKQHNLEMEKLANQTKLSAMGEMIGNIAHQWRQPLSVISTSATGMLMQKEYGLLSDEQFEKSCNAINDNAQYLSKTIDDFKDFIKGNDKKENFTIKTLLDKALAIAQSIIKDNQIELILDNKQDIQLFGTLNMLMQAIVNIINNAKDILVEKNIENKLIFISIDKKEDNIILSIKDNGGGVPKDIIPKIFEAYFTTKHQSQGTGLGLNMAYNIVVNGFNGLLEVENVSYTYEDTQYTGAKFNIKIPI